MRVEEGDHLELEVTGPAVAACPLKVAGGDPTPPAQVGRCSALLPFILMELARARAAPATNEVTSSKATYEEGSARFDPDVETEVVESCDAEAVADEDALVSFEDVMELEFNVETENGKENDPDAVPRYRYPGVPAFTSDVPFPE